MQLGLAVIIPMALFAILDFLIVFNTRRNYDTGASREIFLRFGYCTIVMQSLNTITYSCDYSLISLPVRLNYIISIVACVCLCAVGYYWFRYLFLLINGDRDYSRKRNFLISLPLNIASVLIFSTPWTGLVFTIDDAGKYHTGTFGIVQVILPYSYFVMAIFGAAIAARKRTWKAISHALIFFTLFLIPTFVGSFIQLVVFRGGYTQIGISIAYILIYFEQYMDEIAENKRLKGIESLNNELQAKNEEQNAQLEEIRDLNKKLEVNQERLEESTAKQEAQIEEITTLNRSLERQMNIISSMGKVYYAAYFIDLQTDSFIEINSKEKIADVVGNFGMAQSALNLMSEKLIKPEYHDDMVEFINLSTLNERLKDKDFVTFEYEGLVSGWSQAYLIAGDRDKKGTFYQAFFAARTIKDEKEREEKVKAIIEGLSREYHSVWVVDKDTLQMELVRSSGPGVIKNAVKIGLDYAYYDAIFAHYIERYVVAEDRERMLRETASQEVLRQLSENTWYEVNFLRRDDEGQIGYHQVAFANADATDGRRQFVIGFRNIDDIVKEERAVKEELQNAKLEAQAANNAKTTFLFNMSHDIRTPMNAILGYTELIEKHMDDAARCEDYINKIRSSGTFLLSLINNVLEMARIESGKVSLDETVCFAKDITDNIVDVYAELMKSKKIEFEPKYNIEPKYIYCDKVKLEEVFLNIVSNAYKYTPEGGKVSIEVNEISTDRPGYILVQSIISDTGIGMSKEYLPRLFEEFSREQNVTESKIEGTGLGMPIVKQFIELMGGTIEVESEPGKGTTFTITIPHKLAEEVAKPNEKASSDITKLEGRRVLLAEDNELNAEIACEFLSEAGIEAEVAANGVQCIDMLVKSEPGYYDLILMDVQMPILNGYETTVRIRELEDKEKASIPIIAMTANAFERDKQDAFAAGMNGHIAKPISVSGLMEAITGIL